MSAIRLAGTVKFKNRRIRLFEDGLFIGFGLQPIINKP